MYAYESILTEKEWVYKEKIGTPYDFIIKYKQIECAEISFYVKSDDIKYVQLSLYCNDTDYIADINNYIVKCIKENLMKKRYIEEKKNVFEKGLVRVKIEPSLSAPTITISRI